MERKCTLLLFFTTIALIRLDVNMLIILLPHVIYANYFKIEGRWVINILYAAALALEYGTITLKLIYLLDKFLHINNVYAMKKKKKNEEEEKDSFKTTYQNSYNEKSSNYWKSCKSMNYTGKDAYTDKNISDFYNNDKARIKQNDDWKIGRAISESFITGAFSKIVGAGTKVKIKDIACAGIKSAGLETVNQIHGDPRSELKNKIEGRIKYEEKEKYSVNDWF